MARRRGRNSGNNNSLLFLIIIGILIYLLFPRLQLNQEQNKRTSAKAQHRPAQNLLCYDRSLPRAPEKLYQYPKPFQPLVRTERPML